MAKTVVGMVEVVTLYGEKHQKTLLARIDTGATRSSVDDTLAKELQLGPTIKTRLVKAAHGTRRRPIMKVRVKLAGHTMSAEFNVADRSHMKFKVLIGRNVLRRGFLIDPSSPTLEEKGKRTA